MDSKDKVFTFILLGIVLITLFGMIASIVSTGEKYKQYNVCLKNNQPKDVCEKILRY